MRPRSRRPESGARRGPRRIAFFGLGVMGFPMAGRLISAGHKVAGYDLSEARLAAWRRRYKSAPLTPDEAEIVITCLPDEATVVKLLLGADGLAAQARPGTLFIDHTTASAAIAREIAAAASSAGALAVDAPTSGRREGAERGRLSIMLGGSDEAVTLAQPVLRCYAQRITHFGPAGAGQMAKLANQVAIAGIVRGLAEAVMLARAGGLAPASLLAALAAGSAGSKQLKRLAPVLAETGWSFDDLFSWLAKDLRLALAESRRADIPLPMTKLVSSLLPAS
jgi:3-hydroxyisobutyrate dehydrogenase